jgi:hypothetical protein
MNPTMIKVRVHRFRGYVAIDIHDGSTVYLKPEHAELIAMALADCAHSCTFEDYTENTFGGVRDLSQMGQSS